MRKVGQVLWTLRSLIVRHPLLVVFVSALLIRLAFSFYFQQFYFGCFVFKYFDSRSYFDPILNLINHGTYIGDWYLEDSKYFRVPVYPAFLGLVHLIFGSAYFDYAVAFLQSVIDAFSALLVYKILFIVSGSSRTALWSGLLYATYPFIVLWSPIRYTEILQTFLIFLLLYMVLTSTRSKKSLLLQGALAGVLVLTKQYLGLMILVPLFTMLFSEKRENVPGKLISGLMLLIGMGIVLSPWVSRNYVHSGEVIVLKGETTGLRDRGPDFEAFERFANLFNENITPMFYGIAFHGKTTFEKHAAFVDRHRSEIDAAVQKAHECGTSFMEIREKTTGGPPHTGCDQEVARGFEKLTRTFWREVPFIEALETRRDALKKIVLKSDISYKNIAFSNAQLFKTALFKYRVLLLALGLIGIVFLLGNGVACGNRPFVLGVALTAMAFYAFFALVIVHVEMRYLLLPDLLISIFAPVAVAALAGKMKRTGANRTPEHGK